MLNIDKRFKNIYNEIIENVITDNPSSKLLMKLFYLEGLIEGIEMSKDTIKSSQIKEIVAEIQSK